MQVKRKKKVASILKGTFRICLWSEYGLPITENTVEKTQFLFCAGNLLCFSSDSFTDNRFLTDHPEFLVTVLISDNCAEVKKNVINLPSVQECVNSPCGPDQ